MGLAFNATSLTTETVEFPSFNGARVQDQILGVGISFSKSARR